jgi:hypothetical protein
MNTDLQTRNEETKTALVKRAPHPPLPLSLLLQERGNVQGHFIKFVNACGISCRGLAMGDAQQSTSKMLERP